MELHQEDDGQHRRDRKSTDALHHHRACIFVAKVVAALMTIVLLVAVIAWVARAVPPARCAVPVRLAASVDVAAFLAAKALLKTRLGLVARRASLGHRISAAPVGGYIVHRALVVIGNSCARRYRGVLAFRAPGEEAGALERGSLERHGGGNKKEAKTQAGHDYTVKVPFVRAERDRVGTRGAKSSLQFPFVRAERDRVERGPEREVRKVLHSGGQMQKS